MCHSKFGGLMFLFLFDIDGTILSVKKGIARKIFQKTLSELFDICIEEHHMPGFNGMTDLSIVGEIASNAGIPNITNYEMVWNNLFPKFQKELSAETVKLLPGITELITNLNSRDDCALGLVTGNFRDNAFLKLDIHSLGTYFNFGAYGCDRANRNELPLIALKRAELKYNKTFSPDQTLVIGDTSKDVICAKASGMKSVAVATGGANMNDIISLAPDLVLDSFSDYNYSIDLMINLVK